MNITSKIFNKKIIKEEDNYYLLIYVDFKFNKLNYKIFGKEEIIIQGCFKKYKKNKIILIPLELDETLYISINKDNSKEYYEIIDKDNILNLKSKYNNKNILINIEKKNDLSINKEIENVESLIKDFSNSNMVDSKISNSNMNDSNIIDSELVNINLNDNNSDKEDSDKEDSDKEDSDKEESDNEINKESWNNYI